MSRLEVFVDARRTRGESSALPDRVAVRQAASRAAGGERQIGLSENLWVWDRGSCVVHSEPRRLDLSKELTISVWELLGDAHKGTWIREFQAVACLLRGWRGRNRG